MVIICSPIANNYHFILHSAINDVLLQSQILKEQDNG